MNKIILLGGNQKHFDKNDLPMLIHASAGSGGSLFSISVIADLYIQGAKILSLTGYHMARDEFKEQTNSAEDYILVNDQSQLQEAHHKRVIFVAKETPELFIKLVKSLPDIDERVIFYKNFDLFDVSVLKVIQGLRNLVLMGDVDNTPYKDRLTPMSWASRIYFSEPTSYKLDFTLPDLDRYQGYLRNKDSAGLVTLGE